MFKNNNGSVIKRISKSSLKANRRRNIYIIITIALSACLMSSLALLALGVKQEKINNVTGMYQATFKNVSEKTYGDIKNDDSFEKVGEYCPIGQKKFDGYSLSSVYMDENMLLLTKYSTEGAMPQNPNDVMLEKRYLSKLGKNIGNTVKLDLGDGPRDCYISGTFYNKEEEKTKNENKTENTNYLVVCSESYLKAKIPSDKIKRMVGVSIADSSRLPASEIENEIYDSAKEHGISRDNVSKNTQYFLAIKPAASGANAMFLFAVGILIAFAASLVIYSIFYISVTSRVREYGQLRTIGTTQKQIKKIISREGRVLSAIGIPFGLAAACIIAAAVVPKGFKPSTAVEVCLATAALTFIVVHFAVRKPMKIAAKTSPIEAIRYSAAAKDMKTKKTGKLHRKLTPTSLAAMNFSRSRKKAVLTMLSLGFSGILFMCAASFSSSTTVENYTRRGGFDYGWFQLYLTGKNSNDSDGFAVSRIQQNNPLNKSLKDKILSIDGVTGIKAEKKADVTFNLRNEQRLCQVGAYTKKDEKKINENIKSGTCSYDKLRSQNGIFATVASTDKDVFGWLPAVGDKMKIEFFTSKGVIQKEFTVMGTTDNRPIENGDFLLPEETLDEIAGTDTTFMISVDCKQSKKASVENALKSITASNTSLALDTLDSEMETSKNQIQSALTVIYTIVFVTMLFGIINLMNTIVTNVLTRKQELGILQAIGLSNKQMNKMLQMEGLFYTLDTVFMTLTVGTLLGWLICIGMRKFMYLDYIKYNFPILQAALFIAVFLIAQALISLISARSLKKQSLVERMQETQE